MELRGPQEQTRGLKEQIARGLPRWGSTKKGPVKQGAGGRENGDSSRKEGSGRKKITKPSLKCRKPATDTVA